MRKILLIILTVTAFSLPAQGNTIGGLSIIDRNCGTVTLTADLDPNWNLITNHKKAPLRIRWIENPIDQGSYQEMTSSTTSFTLTGLKSNTTYLVSVKAFSQRKTGGFLKLKRYRWLTPITLSTLECTPTVDFEINGSSSPVVASCGAGFLLLDGSGTLGESQYFVSMQKSDRWWNRFGDEVTGWFPGEVPDDFDLESFARGGGLELEGGTYYRVKLAIADPWQEETRLLHILPASAEMTVNGGSGSVIETTLGKLIMDGRFSFCELAYFVGMQRSDTQGGRLGPEHAQWFGGEAPESIDLAAFWKRKQGESLKLGCYWVKLAVAGPWQQDERLVCLK